MTDKRRIAIIGESECGKTSLSVGLSLGLWEKYGLRSLVFDPWLREDRKRWGAHSWATDEWEKFEHVVFKVKNCAVFWDEGSTTGGRDSDKVKFFTAIRHDHPAFFFLGHAFASMLPIMRGSLTDVMLFNSHADEVEKWAVKFNDEDLMQATAIPQYSCVQKRKFKPVVVRAPSIAELKTGILP